MRVDPHVERKSAESCFSEPKHATLETQSHRIIPVRVALLRDILDIWVYFFL